MLQRLKVLIRPEKPEDKPVNTAPPMPRPSSSKVTINDDQLSRTLRQLEEELPDPKIFIRMFRLCETTAEKAFLVGQTHQGQVWAQRLLSLAHLWNACYGKLPPDHQPEPERLDRAKIKHKNLVRQHKSLLGYKQLDSDGLPANCSVLSDNAIGLVTLGVSDKQTLLDLVREQPGVSREQLYNASSDAQAVVQNKLKGLHKMGLVKREKLERVIRYYAL
ncbi:MAG: hypothetical protein M0028_01960 [Clostridia bacterium]|nr:hypothetical protein [Clostridia bacterium]